MSAGGRRTRRRTLVLAALAGAVLTGSGLAAAGCAAVPGAAPAASASPSASGPGSASGSPGTPASPAPSATAAASSCDPGASSLAPEGPPKVTAGSYMATIKARGYLIAGVDQSTYHFGYLNPLDGKIEGFDIDQVRAVAQAIFGDPGKVRFKAISDAQRMPAVLDGSVDLVAHTMTITCDRLRQVDFSSVYFESHQRVLVPDNSRAKGGLADLGGQKVCATTGSDSVATIERYPTHPRVVQVPYWTDCLVLLQQDQVAAISTDDSILDGLAVQDPFTEVVGPALTDEPYGLAMSKRHPDFVRFVNAVLAKEESDGAWQASYRHWVGTPAESPPPARYAR